MLCYVNNFVWRWPAPCIFLKKVPTCPVHQNNMMESQDSYILKWFQMRLWPKKGQLLVTNSRSQSCAPEGDTQGLRYKEERVRIALFSPLSLSHTLMSSEDLSPHKSNFLLLIRTPAATHRTTSCSATLQAGAPTREAACTLPLQLFWRMDDLEAQMSPNWVKI